MGILHGRHRLRHTGIAVGSLLLCSGLTAANASANQAMTPPVVHRAVASQSGQPGAQNAAAFPDVIVRGTGVRDGAAVRTTGTAPGGYGPADLRSAYNLVSAAASGGKGATVAVIGVDDDPTAAADLAAYRSQYKLPACTTASGCLRKVNEDGQPSPLPLGAPTDNSEWTRQEAADMDLVSALCPNCHILLVETSEVWASDMGTAVDSAVQLGARYVIIGWSLNRTDPIAAVDQDFNHPGVAIVAAAGDSGYVPYCCSGLGFFPADLQQVVSVGGTTLTRASNARGWSETVWGPPGPDDPFATSSGCVNSVFGKPSWQTDAGCAGRTQNDVAADADPGTGVSFYDTSAGDRGWLVAGGTAVSAAIVGSVYALAGPPAADTYPVSFPYADTADLYPVTSGCDVPGCSDGPAQPGYLYQAGPGYNGPAGWGTPDGTAAFTTPSQATVAMISPGEQEARVLPETVHLQIGAGDSAGLPLTYSATGLPPGASIDPATGLISGTVTSYYDGQATVTATDADGAGASVSFPWLARDYIAIAAQSVQQVEPGSPVSLSIRATDAARNEPLTYTATGLPTGLAIGSSGTITGVADTIGTYGITVTASDSTGSSASVTFTLHVWNTIAVTVPTAIASDEVSSVGFAIAPIDVTATDSAAGQTLTYSAAALPAGLSIDPATGVISGTPTAKTESTVTVTAADGTGSQGSTSVLWFVNGEITITSPGTQTTVAGQTVQLPLKVTDTAANDTLIYPVTGAPPGLDIDWNTATFEGWPTTPGTYKTTVTAQEQTGGGTASVTFSWIVKPAPTTGPTGQVRLDLGGKCLNDAGNKSASGTNVEIWKCTPNAAQRWVYAPDGTLRIHGKCATATGKTTGSKVVISPCTDAGNQTWVVGTGAELVNSASGRCLADPGASTRNGTWTRLGRCLNGARDAWTLPAGPIESGIRGQCMTDSGGRTANGTKVVISGCDGSKAQRWTVEPDGTVRIFGKCLTLRSGAWSGAPAVLWSCGNNGYYQQWPIPLSDTLAVAIQGGQGSALGVPPGKTGNGTQLVTVGNAGTAGTLWHIW